MTELELVFLEQALEGIKYGLYPPINKILVRRLTEGRQFSHSKVAQVDYQAFRRSADHDGSRFEETGNIAIEPFR